MDMMGNDFEMLLAILVLVIVVYVIVYIASRAFFSAKMRYNKDLIDNLKERSTKNGEEET